MPFLVKIVIPVYKELPDEDEVISLKQVLRILPHDKYAIISPNGLNLTYYENILKEFDAAYSIEYFDLSYFNNGLEGYNQLMLSQNFYNRFLDSEYILICQLDACVFKDELEYWCTQGYDYIGSPWPPEFIEPYATDLNQWRVGNGGFSLRRVKSILHILNYRFPVRGFKYFWHEKQQFSLFKRFLWFPVTVLKACGYHNTIPYYLKHFPAYEDMFLSLYLDDTKLRLKKPDPITASRFSVERGVDIIQQGKKDPPFGVHAWKRNAPEYWMQFMVDIRN